MRKAWHCRTCGILFAVAVAWTLVANAHAQPASPAAALILHSRVREAGATESRPEGPQTQEKMLRWDPAQTAIIICDMWNQHWCKGATRRVGELAPAMNRASPRRGPRAS